MNLLPALAPTSHYNIADLFTKPLSSHRYTQLVIGDAPTTYPPSTSVASTVDSVTVATTVVASASAPTAATTSDSVPTALPIVLGTGASLALTPFTSDFTLEVAQAPYGLFRSASSLVSNSKVTSVVSSFEATSVDPYTLITGEDVSVDSDPVDLSSPDTTAIDSDLSCFTKVYFDIKPFGTSILTFIYSKSTLELLHIFVTPTQVDWIHWIPVPRLILPESYFHIFGLDYLQAFTLFHLIPIWIYSLLHFAVTLED